MAIENLAQLTTAYGDTALASSNDTDEVIAACTDALRPHALHVRDRRARLSTRLAHVPVVDVSVNRLIYGADVTVSPADPDQDNFLLTLPVDGTAEFRYGGATAPATPAGGVMVGPYREFEFSIDAAFDQVIVRLDRTRVESVAALMTGVTGPVHFDLPLADGVRRLSGALETAVGLAASPLRDSRPQLLWQLEQVLIESLLLGQPNSSSRALGEDAPVASSARVRRAVDYMRDHLAEPVSVTGVAAECGVSVRTLQESFRRELGTTPRRWLRLQRLERAHALLSSGAEGLTVTDVAYACGFFHLGEFGAAFKGRYGITPSDLLASAR